jgi:hypothetical protein
MDAIVDRIIPPDVKLRFLLLNVACVSSVKSSKLSNIFRTLISEYLRIWIGAQPKSGKTYRSTKGC